MPYKDVERRREFFRRRHETNVAFVRSHKLRRGCADCGYRAHHAGLQFDHVKPRLRGTVASLMGKSIRFISEEMERCDVVCGTCHGVREWNRRYEKPRRESNSLLLVESQAS